MTYQHDEELMPNTKSWNGHLCPPHCHSSEPPPVWAHCHVELGHSHTLPAPSLCSSRSTGKAVQGQIFSVISSKRNRLFQKQVAWRDQEGALSHRTTTAPQTFAMEDEHMACSICANKHSSQSLHELPNNHYSRQHNAVTTKTNLHQNY